MSQNLIAIYGGTFDPFHMGHIHCIQTIFDKTKVDQIFVVPAFQNPLKENGEGPTPEQRLEMVKVGVQDFDDVVVDEQEILRQGKSYSIDTVNNYLQEYAPEQIHLVVGLDEFYQLHRWKDFDRLLNTCNFLVVSRPGNMLPLSAEDLPDPLKNYVEALDRTFIALKTGRTVEFLRVPGFDVAATEIRKFLKTGRSVDKFLDLRVQEYIREHKLYPLIGPTVGDYLTFTEYCADRLYYRKAVNLRAYDLTMCEAPTGFAIVASGTSKRHAQSLAESVKRDVKNQYGINPLSIEGMEEGRWVVLDYGDLIVHVFYDYVRMEYNLESLWKKGVDLKFKDPYQGV